MCRSLNEPNGWKRSSVPFRLAFAIKTNLTETLNKSHIQIQRRLQPIQIFLTRNLDRPHACRMLRQDLCIEKCIAADAQIFHEIRQRHLRGIADAVEHRLAREEAAD